MINYVVVHHFLQLNKEEALKALPHKAKEVSLEEAYEVVIQPFKIYLLSIKYFLYLVLLQQGLTTLEKNVNPCYGYLY